MNKVAQKLSLLGLFLFIISPALSQDQKPDLPLNFEKEPIIFTDAKYDPSDIGFDGGKGWVVSNPHKFGINKSPKVGKIIRDGGVPHAGSAIPLRKPFDFREKNVISFKVYTSAPDSTEILLKLEDGGYLSNGAFEETSEFTTKTNEWELLNFTFPRINTNFDRIVLMFDFGSVGNGSEESTFYFDNFIQTSWEAIDNPPNPVIVHGEEYKTNEGISD